MPDADIKNPVFTDFQLLFKALPGNYLVLAPDLSILTASNLFLKTFHHCNLETLLATSVFEAFQGYSSSAGQWQEAMQFIQDQEKPYAIQLTPNIDTLTSYPKEPNPATWYLTCQPVYQNTQQLSYILVQATTSVPDLLTGTAPEKQVTSVIQKGDQQQNVYRELAKRIEQSQFLAETIPSFIWITDAKGETIYQNQQFYDFTGTTPEQVAGHQWASVLHPDDVERVQEAWEQIKTHRLDYDIEYRIRRKDGEYHWLLTKARVMYDNQGTLVGWVGAGVDINDQKQAQEQATFNEQNFKLLADFIPQLIWTTDYYGQVDYFNQRWFEYTGLSPADSLGKKWREVVHPDDRSTIRRRWKEYLALGQDPEVEYRIRRNDGVYQWFLVRATPVRDEQGNITKWFGTCTNIHDQKQIQARLEESNAYFRHLAESLPQLVWTTDAAGKPDYFNSQWQRLLGSSADFPPGWNWTELLHPDEKQQVIAEGYQAIQAGITFETEYRIKAPDGSYRWFLSRAIPFRGENGVITKWIGTATDIHELVQVRQQLKANADQVTKVLDALPQMTWTARPDGGLNYYSRQWFNYLGADLESLTEWGWAKYVHPDDLEGASEAWFKSLASGVPLVTQNRMLSKDSTYRWFLVCAMPIRDQTGEITMWVGSNTDIEDQKQIQQRLEESNQYFKFLSETIPQIVWTAEADGSVDFFNKNWYTYTGYNKSTLGWGWDKVVHPDDLALTNQTWLNSIKNGVEYQIEYRLRNGKTGKYQWFLGRARPMRNLAGIITKWFGTCTDIEEQKQAEKILLSKNEELKKINEDLDRFVYTASHDLKLPIINMASIFKELQESAIYQDPESDKLIQMFHKALQQIYATINDLSEVAKFQKNIYDSIEEVNLHDLTEEIKQSIQDLITSSGAQIRTDYNQIPTLQFSKGNLKSIIYNLLSNAIKYQAPERPPLVELCTTQQGNYTVLSVTDNGLGINLEKNHDKLFQMYKRFHNHVPGTGLGLYIVKRIMDNNQGYIEVESIINEGTTFKIYFLKKD